MRVITFGSWFWKQIYSNALQRNFRSIGKACFIEYPAIVKGPQYISIGNYLRTHPQLRLEALDRRMDTTYNPEIKIADHVEILFDCHIGCVNRISIGNNVLIASKVFITDHSHGEIDAEVMNTPPQLRKIMSRGPVIIEDNVWIGEGTAILQNVRIGKNSIIGANAVVTRDIPDNCVAAGVPPRIIRRLEECAPGSATD